MHHLARRTAAVTMTLAAAALLFTGCSNSNSDSSSSTTSSSATQSSAETTTQSAGAGETKIQTPSGEFTVSGHLLAKYQEMGGVSSPLGPPTANAVSGPDGGSCQEFTGGVICWSEKTQAHVAWGEIRKKWESEGGVNGKFGYPTSDEKDVPGGKESDFTGGTISWVNQQISVTMK
ncbi:LGFP repeat-containing protein [Nocardia alni]|uniref:LGFP repeat-containing protein n=1 Tax=Nocardia alni TaxID=2815723 RepID=UPI001C245620|nr:esterase [Nocardia alni]